MRKRQNEDVVVFKRGGERGEREGGERGEREGREGGERKNKMYF